MALDQPWAWNRFGALEPQGMMYALRRDVVPTSDADGLPDPGVTYTLNAGQVTLRRDKRPRPLVLRVNAGGCLHVRFTNLLASTVQSPRDEQPSTRAASMHFVGLEAVNSIHDMGSNVGNNPAAGNGIVAPNGAADYWLYAPKEGTYVFYSAGAMTGGEGDGGQHLLGPLRRRHRRAGGRASGTAARSPARTSTRPHRRPRPRGRQFPTLNYDAVYPAGHR